MGKGPSRGVGRTGRGREGSPELQKPMEGSALVEDGGLDGLHVWPRGRGLGYQQPGMSAGVDLQAPEERRRGPSVHRFICI